MKNNNLGTRIIMMLMISIMSVSMLWVSTDSVFAINELTTSKKEYQPNAKKSKDEAPTVLGEAAVLIDAKTGKVLFEADKDEQNLPASTTKMMTALLALEHFDIDDTITADEESEHIGGSRIYVYDGEEIKVDDLLYATLVESANDAAFTLGKAIAGSNKAFVEMMNEKAEELGLENTHFANSNGLPDKNHYSSAYDLALIAKEAMKNEDFRRYVSTYEYKMPKTNKAPKRQLHSHNRLLFNINRKVSAYGETKSIKYDGVTGIKTGFTNEARMCLVGGAERDGTEFIAVSLKSEGMNVFQDVVSMLDYGFNNFKTEMVMEKDDKVDALDVSQGEDDKVDVIVKKDIMATLPIDADKDDIIIKKDLADKVDAPAKEGKKVGSVSVYYDDELIDEADAILAKSVEEKPKSILGSIVKVVLIILGVLVLLIILLRIYNKIRIKRIAKRRAMRRGEL